jgi:uncharacterized membrane protein YdcZ (DUF606 family)
MADKKEGRDIVAYVLGIISIVTAFITSYGIGGIIFGIIGLMQSRKEKSELSKKAKKYSITGIVLGGIIFIISVTITVLSLFGQLSTLPVS